MNHTSSGSDDATPFELDAGEVHLQRMDGSGTYLAIDRDKPRQRVSQRQILWWCQQLRAIDAKLAENPPLSVVNGIDPQPLSVGSIDAVSACMTVLPAVRVLAFDVLRLTASIEQWVRRNTLGAIMTRQRNGSLVVHAVGVQIKNKGRQSEVKDLWVKGSVDVTDNLFNSLLESVKDLDEDRRVAVLYHNIDPKPPAEWIKVEVTGRSCREEFMRQGMVKRQDRWNYSYEGEWEKVRKVWKSRK